MNTITNSTIKESIRLKNEENARQNEITIMRAAENRINSLKSKNTASFAPFVVVGVIVGIVLACVGLGFIGFLIGVGVGIGIRVAVNASVKNFNANLESEKREIRRQAENNVSQAYTDADNRTQQEIIAYERDVELYAKKTQNNADSLSPMIEHSVNMFQRMISHADSGSHMRFVEADLMYVVMNSGIHYSYSSTYTNPQDDFIFNIQRYRDLNSPAECEGLAQTLARLIIARMKKIYPPNSINITLTHNDAAVTLHFKGANKNFVPARDII